MKRFLAYSLSISSAIVLCTAAFAGSNATTSGGGSHSGHPVAIDSFAEVLPIAADAHDFKVGKIKKISVPTAGVVTGEPCMPSDEHAQNCETTQYTAFADAYRVTVSYISDSTKMVSDEYPESNEWTEDFIVSVDKLSHAATPAAAVRGVTRTTYSRLETQVTQACARALVGETEWRLVDPNCQDQTQDVMVSYPAIELDLAN